MNVLATPHKTNVLETLQWEKPIFEILRLLRLLDFKVLYFEFDCKLNNYK